MGGVARLHVPGEYFSSVNGHVEIAMVAGLLIEKSQGIAGDGAFVRLDFIRMIGL